LGPGLGIFSVASGSQFGTSHQSRLPSVLIIELEFASHLILRFKRVN